MFTFVPWQSKRSKPGRSKSQFGVRLGGDTSSSLPGHAQRPARADWPRTSAASVFWQTPWFSDITLFFGHHDKSSLKKNTNKDVYYRPAVGSTTQMPNTRHG